MAGRNTKARARRPGDVLYLPIAFLLICGALFLSMCVFFRATNITVDGNKLYTQEEILKISELKSGQNMFFVNRFAVEKRLQDALPYVEGVSLSRVLPNTLQINIKESYAIAIIQIGDKNYLINQNCKVLGEAEKTTGYIRIKGISLEVAKVGRELTGERKEDSKEEKEAKKEMSEKELETLKEQDERQRLEAEQKLEVLRGVLTGIELHGMAEQITELDVSNLANPVFDYMGRFQVRFGDGDNVSYKLDMLQAAAEQLSESETGTFDLTTDNKVHFRYN